MSFESSNGCFLWTSYLFPPSLFFRVELYSPAHCYDLFFTLLMFRVLTHCSQPISGFDFSLSCTVASEGRSLLSLVYIMLVPYYNQNHISCIPVLVLPFLCTFVLNSRFFSLRETFDPHLFWRDCWAMINQALFWPLLLVLPISPV